MYKMKTLRLGLLLLLSCSITGCSREKISFDTNTPKPVEEGELSDSEDEVEEFSKDSSSIKYEDSGIQLKKVPIPDDGKEYNQDGFLKCKKRKYKDSENSPVQISFSADMKKPELEKAWNRIIRDEDCKEYEILFSGELQMKIPFERLNPRFYEFCVSPKRGGWDPKFLMKKGGLPIRIVLYTSDKIKKVSLWCGNLSVDQKSGYQGDFITNYRAKEEIELIGMKDDTEIYFSTVLDEVLEKSPIKFLDYRWYPDEELFLAVPMDNFKKLINGLDFYVGDVEKSLCGLKASEDFFIEAKKGKQKQLCDRIEKWLGKKVEINRTVEYLE